MDSLKKKINNIQAVRHIQRGTFTPSDSGGSGQAYLKTNYDQDYYIKDVEGSYSTDATWTINKLCRQAEYYSVISDKYSGECTQCLDYVEITI